MEGKNSTEDHNFEIRVALVGYVSVGKSTVINALLGDQFSEVSMRRTTAGFNHFRVSQKSASSTSTSTSVAETITETGIKTETGGEGEKIRDEANKGEGGKASTSTSTSTSTKRSSAEETHAIISKDNGTIRSDEKESQSQSQSSIVLEKFFDIEVDEAICDMRNDTKLVLIDIPGINEADSSKKYKEYVEQKWDSFDCVCVVMDAMAGVNTLEQVELLKFVHQNNQTLKRIPTIVLGNKVDDPTDEDTLTLVEETREKTIEIFGQGCTEKSLQSLLDAANNGNFYAGEQTKKNNQKQKGRNKNKSNKNKNSDDDEAVFIPISAKNAFIYRKARHLTLDIFHEFDRDVMEKIGRDEVGRKWKKMSTEEKVTVIREAISDPKEYKERLAGTNFDNFLTILTYFIGGCDAQHHLLTSQIDVALKMMMSYNYDNESSITESIHDIFKKSKIIGQTSTDDLKDTFWRVYDQCEDNSFDKVEKELEPKFLQRPMMELERYHKLAVILKWDKELKIISKRMQGLLRRSFSLVIRKKECWSMSGFLDDLHPNDHWTKPDKVQWTNLSPHDWITILFSIVLASRNIEVSQSFGREIRSIEGSLLHLRMHYEPTMVTLINNQYPYGETEVESQWVYNQACHAMDESSNIKDAIIKLEMPEDLSNPCHWGYIAWKYVHISRSIDISK
mmetsp:Transcript_18099/g.20273  ORF Transcript_18099/g.20273 Transcript_18099/m.20273 type:complete len:677 (-) Transcript_18099:143-2173(-)